MATNLNLTHRSESSLKKEYPHFSTSLSFVVLILILFLFISPFSKALFNGGAGLVNMNQFERPIYYTFLVSAAVAFILCIFLYRSWILTERRAMMSLYIWLIPVTYALSYLFAASSHVAKNAIFIQLVYVTFFLVALYLSNSIGARWFAWGIMGSGYVIVWYGFANLFGNTFYRHAVMIEEYGLRLTSVFQYANAYAAYLIALLLACLVSLLYSRSKWVVGLQAFMLVPILVSFWLTLSRGGLVVLPVIVLLVLPFFDLIRQITLLVFTGLGMIVSAVISSKMTDQAAEMQAKINESLGSDMKPGFLYPLTDPLSGPKWLILIGVSLLTALVLTIVQVWVVPRLEVRFKTWTERRWTRYFVPFASVVAGSVGLWLLLQTSVFSGLLPLPDTIEQRIENINFRQHSVLERGTFYMDSFKLFADYPLFGKGGGAWSVMYQEYQNNPYTSRQAHSFYLQYLNETGIVGLTVLLVLIIYIFYQFIRYYFKTDASNKSVYLIFYVFSVALLIHSAIDFEMSYVYLGALLFLCLGGLAYVRADEPVSVPKWMESLRLRYVYPSLVLVLSLVFFTMSTVFLAANNLYNQSIANAMERKPINEIIAPLNKAIDLQPHHPEYLQLKFTFMLQVYNQSKDQKHLEEAQKVLETLKLSEPYMRQIVEYDFEINRILGKPEQSVPVLEDAVRKFQWDIQVYEKLLALYTELGEKARIAKNTSEMDRYYAKALELVHRVREKEAHLQTLPKEQLQGRPFGFTASMALSLAQVYYGKGQYEDLTRTLQPFMNPKLEQPIDLAIARMYIVGLMKQNQNDDTLYQALLQKDPAERKKIRSLLAQ